MTLILIFFPFGCAVAARPAGDTARWIDDVTNMYKQLDKEDYKWIEIEDIKFSINFVIYLYLTFIIIHVTLLIIVYTNDIIL